MHEVMDKNQRTLGIWHDQDGIGELGEYRRVRGNRGVTAKIYRMNNGRNIGTQYLVGSVRTDVREPPYYVIDIFYFLSDTCKYF